LRAIGQGRGFGEGRKRHEAIDFRGCGGNFATSGGWAERRHSF